MNYIDAANDELARSHEPPQSISEYIDQVFEHPTQAVHAAQYVLDAIEAAGTRPVTHAGDELTRYRFFDDPYNDGEHAVIGNTRMLNTFVDTIRAIAHDSAKDEKMLWVTGPTGSGKSELKRCLINGLREYSKTEAGRRHTLEWNIANTTDTGSSRVGYIEQDTAPDEDDWYISPIQTHPLSVLPAQVQQRVVADLDDELGSDTTLSLSSELDPFSQEAYDHLVSHYSTGRSESDIDTLFSAVTDDAHCRVTNYVVDEGQGIGVLNADDGGDTKQRLVGTWMPSLLQELDSRGQKNPQAFSYDGVLSQGNGGMTIVEDTGQHIDLLQKLFNIPDEEYVKLDTNVRMDIDTVILLISNPDVDAKLNVDGGLPQGGLRALKRRLARHDLTYLLSYTLAGELLHRELFGAHERWSGTDDMARLQRLRSGVTVTVGGDERELAPHTLATAALFGVATRFASETADGEFNAVDKALLYEHGESSFRTYDYNIDDMPDVDAQRDIAQHATPSTGVPPTFIRDVVYELYQEGTDREHHTYDVGSVIMPSDVLETLSDRMETEPMFDGMDTSAYSTLIGLVSEYAVEQQEADVLEAILSTKRVGPEGVTEYLKQAYAWAGDDGAATDIDVDPLKLRTYEVERFGLFSADEYTDDGVSDAVEQWRTEEIREALITANYNDAGGESFWDVPEVRDSLYDESWGLVFRLYDNLDIAQWADPPEASQTETVKQQVIDYMVAEHGYTEASAELTSSHVLKHIEMTT